MATKPVEKKNGRPRIKYCACGCGERIVGVRRTKEYVNHVHLVRAGRQRKAEEKS